MIASKWDERRQWIKAYNLELLLCSFVMFFWYCFCLFNLATQHLPQYWQPQNGQYGWTRLDPCSIFLVGFTLICTIGIACRQIKFYFLDSLDIAGLAYILALSKIVGYEGHSYTSLPFQLIAVLNVAFLWQLWIATHWPKSRYNQIALGLAVTTSCAGPISLEHQLPNNFIKTVNKINS